MDPKLLRIVEIMREEGDYRELMRLARKLGVTVYVPKRDNA